MSRPPVRIDEQLAESLRRIGGALEQNRHQYATVVSEILAAADTLRGQRSAPPADDESPMSRRDRRREEQELRREERRRRRQQKEEDENSLSGAIVQAVFAVGCLIFALLRPDFFWMMFVGLGLGTSAASAFNRVSKQRQLAREGRASAGDEATGAGVAPVAKPASVADTTVPPPVPVPPPQEPLDPKVARIQELCDRLLGELETGPAIVREIVTEPGTTIAGLRQACVETARRERELRAVLASQDDARLTAEREALRGRVGAEADPIVRDRLGQALAALDQQIVHRAALATTATRLEAENTRILYTLENVHMQLLRARSTDMGGPELGARLRDSLRDLGTQIEAIAEALEYADVPANAPPGGADQPVIAAATAGPPPLPSASPESADAQRAEREAAARRAAASQQAQRH